MSFEIFWNKGIRSKNCSSGELCPLSFYFDAAYDYLHTWSIGALGFTFYAKLDPELYFPERCVSLYSTYRPTAQFHHPNDVNTDDDDAEIQLTKSFRFRKQDDLSRRYGEYL